MSSLCRVSVLMLALATAGCHRDFRDLHGQALHSSDKVHAFGDNAYHLAQGQRLYAWMNCSGCHSNGGGGMGPPLRDDRWRYGGSLEDIVSTIMNGRPNGMPSFRDKITEEQAWELATYVRSMSARTREDTVAARADKPASVEPLPLDERKRVHRVTPAMDNVIEHHSNRPSQTGVDTQRAP